MRKIVTTYICPPIPSRNNDWCAHYDGEEEAGNYGWGATEAEAIDDFIANCAEDHDERLGDPDRTAMLTRPAHTTINSVSLLKAAKEKAA